jgi:ATP adenylyltransferase
MSWQPDLMNAEQLLNFVTTEMRMSHVYQPLLIRSLLDAGGKASLRQVATDFVSEDEAQLRYYEQRIKAMPLKVLKNHGVCGYDNGVISLKVGKLTFEQRAVLRAACEKRISTFLQQRGEDIWDQGALNVEPLGESLRFEILKRDRVCQLCGAGPKDAVLEVDHVVPRSKGGSNEPDNLQVLCSRCNRGKSNRDSTNFRRGSSPAAS